MTTSRTLRTARLALLAALTVATALPADAGVHATASAGVTSAHLTDVDIERISFHRRSDGRGYVVRLHTDARVPAFSVDETDGGIELVVFRVGLAPQLRRDDAKGPVRSYRVLPEDDKVTFRFVTRGEVEATAYPDRESNDLLLALTTVPSRPAPPVVSTSTSTPSGGGTDGTTNWRLDTIVLDAGHGGDDYGAVANGTSDKEVAIGVVRRLGPMIESELGIRVVYTRRGDEFHTLRERGRIANREGGKLFISVHANAASSSRARGTETFFLAPHRSDTAREVMERENSVIELESDPSLYADFDDEGGILQSLAMSAYQEESQLIATLVEREFVASGRHSRGVKQAPFLVLWAASMPAILVETGFITNPEEARFLASASGQEKTARAIFRAVKAYKEQYERGLRLASTG
ncbi:MAG: N-acetylmuramoyl-L-alanine amidase [Bacteroidota bacterium]